MEWQSELGWQLVEMMPMIMAGLAASLIILLIFKLFAYLSSTPIKIRYNAVIILAFIIVCILNYGGAYGMYMDYGKPKFASWLSLTIPYALCFVILFLAAYPAKKIWFSMSKHKHQLRARLNIKSLCVLCLIGLSFTLIAGQVFDARYHSKLHAKLDDIKHKEYVILGQLMAREESLKRKYEQADKPTNQDDLFKLWAAENMEKAAIAREEYAALSQSFHLLEAERKRQARLTIAEKMEDPLFLASRICYLLAILFSIPFVSFASFLAYQKVIVLQKRVAALSENVKKSAKICPFCAEKIKAQAVVCKHCGRDLPQSTS